MVAKKPGALLILAASASFLSSSAGARCLTLTNAIVLQAQSLIDVRRGMPLGEMLVVVTGEKITAVGRKGEVSLPPGARRIDLGPASLLPGLVDLHVHLTLGGSPDVNARATLQAGFTTVQDLGALDYANVGLRDAITGGHLVGPRVVAAGPWIGRSGGICDFSGIGVHGADAFRARVQEDVAHGVDLIKVCVSGWLQNAVDRPDEYEISDAELAAAIDEAHRHNRRVAVHAISEAGIRVAVRSGADLIVHGGFPDPETVRAMQKRGVRQLTTLHSLAEGSTGTAVDALFGHMKASVGLGLQVAFGTDAGVIPHGRNAEEFAELTRIGLKPAEALRTATLGAAEVLAWGDRIGTIEVGKFADLIAVEGNPLDDLSALKRVIFIMRSGRIYRNALDASGRIALDDSNPTTSPSATHSTAFLPRMLFTSSMPIHSR